VQFLHLLQVLLPLLEKLQVKQQTGLAPIISTTSAAGQIQSQTNNNGLGPGPIAGIVIGSTVGAFLIFFGAIFIIHRVTHPQYLVRDAKDVEMEERQKIERRPSYRSQNYPVSKYDRRPSKQNIHDYESSSEEEEDRRPARKPSQRDVVPLEEGQPKKELSRTASVKGVNVGLEELEEPGVEVRKKSSRNVRESSSRRRDDRSDSEEDDRRRRPSRRNMRDSDEEYDDRRPRRKSSRRLRRYYSSSSEEEPERKPSRKNLQDTSQDPEPKRTKSISDNIASAIRSSSKRNVKNQEEVKPLATSGEEHPETTESKEPEHQ